MFGTTRVEIDKLLASIVSPTNVVLSMLSDVQELTARGDIEEARKRTNVVKYIVDVALEDPQKGECNCGQPGLFRRCPYAMEIDGVEELEYICEDCYEDRCDAI